MTNPSVDFEEIKSFLLSSNDIEKFIRSEEGQEKAMFLFWALDNLQQDKDSLTDLEAQNLEKNSEILKKTQESILKNELKLSLNEYTFGFVLGTLEFTARFKEAQIDHYAEYVSLVSKIEKLAEMRFPNEKFKKYWEETIAGIKEIQGYMATRSDDFFPILAQIVNIYANQRTLNPNKLLKILRKSRSDNLVFQILSGILHSNPILEERIKQLCKEKNVSIKDIKKNLFLALKILKEETEDRKVKEYCQLLLEYKKLKEIKN